jgi:hypothetical protein
MNTRNATMLVVGAAAFLAVGAAAASGQDTTKTRRTTTTKKAVPAKPTSETRIPVTKEAPGEVVPPRVDTVTVYRTDTLTVAGPERVVQTTVTRYDTTRIETLPAYLIERGGMYLGLGGGMSVPAGSLRNVNEAGWNAQAQAGWQPLHSWLGVRGDLNYTQYAENSGYAEIGYPADVLSGNLDLKVGIPLFQKLFGVFPSFSLYGIGGGSYIHSNGLKAMLEEDVPGGFGPLGAVAPGVINKFGWNAGGGMSWHFGATELFTEARVVGFSAIPNSNGAKHIPIVLGFNWY